MALSFSGARRERQQHFSCLEAKRGYGRGGGSGEAAAVGGVRRRRRRSAARLGWRPAIGGRLRCCQGLKSNLYKFLY